MPSTTYAYHGSAPTAKRPPLVTGPARIDSIRLATSSVPPGGVALVRVGGTGLDPAEIRCTSDTPGFVIQQLAATRSPREDIVVTLRIHCAPDLQNDTCLLRFTAGPSTVIASLTVRHRTGRWRASF